MSKSGKLKFGKFIFPLLLLVVVIFVSLKFSELRTIAELFRQAKWWWIAAALAAIFLNYVSMGFTYKLILNILDYPFRLFKLVKSTVVVLFLNQAVPSLSFAGNIFFLNLLRKHGIRHGQGMMTITLEAICYYTDYLILIIFSFLYSFLRGSITRFQIIASIIFLVILVMFAVMIRFWLLSKKNSKKRISWFLRKVNYFGIEEWKKEDMAEYFIEEFREAGRLVKSKRINILAPLFFQLGKFIFDAVAIYFIFWAFNFHMHIGAVMTGYVMARLFGMVSFLPGGVGVVEGGLVLMYTGFGAPLEVAFAVSMIFRAMSFWLPLPVGLGIYKHLESKN